MLAGFFMIGKMTGVGFCFFLEIFPDFPQPHWSGL